MDGEHCTLVKYIPLQDVECKKALWAARNCGQTTVLTALQGASFVSGKCPQQAGATEWRG